MELVKAKCTSCGADLEVNPEAECLICRYCGTPFIVDKAIKNYNTTINNIVNTNVDSDSVSINSQNVIVNVNPNKDNLSSKQTEEEMRKEAESIQNINDVPHPKTKDELITFYEERIKALPLHYFLASFEKQLYDFEKDPTELQMRFLATFTVMAKDKINSAPIEIRGALTGNFGVISSTMGSLNKLVGLSSNSDYISQTTSVIHSGLSYMLQQIGKDVDESKLITYPSDEFANLIAVGNKMPIEYYREATKILSIWAGLIGILISFLCEYYIAAFILEATENNSPVDLAIGTILFIATPIVLFFFFCFLTRLCGRIVIKRVACKRIGGIINTDTNVSYKDNGSFLKNGNNYVRGIVKTHCPCCKNEVTYSKNIQTTFHSKKGTERLPFVEAAKNSIFYLVFNPNPITLEEKITHFLCDKGAKKRVAKSILKASSSRVISPVEMEFAEKYSPKIEEIKNNQAKIIDPAKELSPNESVEKAKELSPNESMEKAKEKAKKKRKKIIITIVVVLTVIIVVSSFVVGVIQALKEYEEIINSIIGSQPIEQSVQNIFKLILKK